MLHPLAFNYSIDTKFYFSNVLIIVSIDTMSRGAMPKSFNLVKWKSLVAYRIYM